MSLVIEDKYPETQLLFKAGKVVEQKVGAVGKTDVQKMLDAHL